MQLNRECVGSNYDVFWFLFYFHIRVPDRAVRYRVTSQNTVYEKVIGDWSPRHWNHGRSCFVGSVDIFRWPTRNCKERHFVSWMTSYPTSNLSRWSVKLWVNKLTLTSFNQNKLWFIDTFLRFFVARAVLLTEPTIISYAVLAPVVQRMDKTILYIDHYPLDNPVGNTIEPLNNWAGCLTFL